MAEPKLGPDMPASETDADNATAESEQQTPLDSNPQAETPEVSVQRPEYSELAQSNPTHAVGSIDRFYDVHMPVWAELGRVEMPIGDLMKLGEGTVLRLNRPISEPVDVVSQGVRLARGEVVVVDDCFAVRVKEIDTSKSK